MPPPEQADIYALIRELLSEGVDFLVVGGAAAVLQGAPVTTFDLDVVIRVDEENAGHLERVLGRLNAFVRDPAGRPLPPTRSHLLEGGQLLLQTDLGPLDLLGRLHDGRTFAELLDHTEEVGEEGERIRVLDLPTLIDVKAGAGRAKDRLVLPILVALLKERESGAS